MASFAPEVLVPAIVIATIAGIVRGVTGFGGAMVMAPPFALLIGPLATVPLVLLLESVAAAPMLVTTRALVRWRTVGPIVAAAAVMVPLGAYVLVNVDAQVMRRVIAAVVIVFSLLLLLGWRYAGEQRTVTGVGLGALAGTLAGATGMGGPPVVLYLLAGSDPIGITRANLTYFVGGVSLAAAAALWWSGAWGLPLLLLAAILAPGYYGGIVVGTRLFARFNDQRYRRFTLALMLLVAIGILLA